MKRKITAIACSLFLAASLVFAITAGPRFPTVATGTTNTIGGGTRVWTNPANINAADGVFATNSLLLGTTSDDLIGTGFGFTIAGTDTINGILLEINYKDNGGPGDINEANVRLLKAGVASGTDKSTGATFTSTATTMSYGGSADLWGTTWTPADINNANFGAAFVCIDTAIDTASVDFFRITITSTAASGAVTTSSRRRRMTFSGR